MKFVPLKNGLDEKKRYICVSNRLLFPKFFVICTRFQKSSSKRAKGEMLEWLKRHAWKACKRQKCFAGSNPALSADYEKCGRYER